MKFKLKDNSSLPAQFLCSTLRAPRSTTNRFIREIHLSLILCIALLCACGTPAQGGDTFTGVCVKVLDGDSIIVRTPKGDLEVRLEGIDAPEHGQDYGEESKAETRRLVLGKRVRGEVKEIDKFGRSVARVYVDEQDLCLMLVKAGAAWKYKYSYDFLLARAEKEARKAKRGLWALPHPEQPWRWRKEHPRQ